MRARNYTSEAIVLARKNYSEADRILILFTKHFGKQSVLAKGIRRPSSRKRGHLEVFSQIKFFAARGRGLDIISEAETIDNFSFIRKDLKKASLAYYFMEVIGKTTHEGEPHKELFDLIVIYLKKLKDGKNLKELRQNFVIDTVVTLGYWPKGKTLLDPDTFLEGVTERKLFTSRVGKRVLA